MTTLNEEQRLAVHSPVGPTLVPAGPGSGKTRVAAERIVWLISNLQAEPSAIIAFTFTNRAARELRQRIAARLTPSEAEALFAGTFHAWGARFLRRYPEPAGLQPNYTIYDQDDSLELVRQSIQDLEIETDNSPRQYLQHISHCKSEDKSPETELARWQHKLDDPHPPDQAVKALIHQRYQQLLNENNAVDFDDLILLPLRVLNNNQDIRADVHSRIRHVIVDEYQDTSRIQHLLVAALLDYPQDQRPSIYAVGDPDQAIYSFRNADIDNIIEFRETHYQDARERQLSINYRSSPQIVQAAQSLIERNHHRIDRTSTPAGSDGPPVDWVQTNNPEQEAKAIAGLIDTMREHDQLQLEECCVIYRTNPQSRSIEEALRAKSITYQVSGNYEFFARAEIKRHIDYLSLAMNPLDATRLRRIANLPPRGLGPKAMETIEEYAHLNEIQLRSAVAKLAQEPGDTLTQSAARGVHILDLHLSTLSQMVQQHQPVTDIIEYIDQDCALIEHYSKQTDGDSRVANIRELSVIAGHRNSLDLRQFLERTSISQEGEPTAVGRVTLATIHQTKGLEFDVVFIAGAEEGLLPHRRSTHSNESIEEERRLMYVAMTRARQRLIISWCRHRRSQDTNTPIRRSRFVDEIEPEAWSKPLPKP